MIQSGDVLPEPLPFLLPLPLLLFFPFGFTTVSLLVTEMIFQPATQHASCATTLILIGTNLWFGGHKVAGLSVLLVITGGIVSCTMMLLSQDVWLPALSATVTPTMLVPN